MKRGSSPLLAHHCVAFGRGVWIRSHFFVGTVPKHKRMYMHRSWKIMLFGEDLGGSIAAGVKGRGEG